MKFIRQLELGDVRAPSHQSRALPETSKISMRQGPAIWAQAMSSQNNSACARLFVFVSGMDERSNRTLLASRYSETRSIAIHRRRRPSATTPVVFDPAKGSM